MERAVAIKKLGKLLGKSLGYRVDPKAPDQDDRDVAREKLRVALVHREALKKEREARRDEILQADAEYQRLKTEQMKAAECCERLSATMRHYRVTVGTSNSMFFTIKAQGDSWEDVIAKLTEKERV
jgi:uncharacterized protein (DUF3084 family)